MASQRRRTGAFAPALTLLTNLVLHQQQEKSDRQKRSQELAEKFKYEALLQEIKRGALGYDFSTGQFTPRTPAGPPQGLTPESYEDPATGVKYGRPRSGSQISAEEEGKFYNENRRKIKSGRPYAGAIPLGEQRQGALQSAVDLGVSESPAAVTGPTQQRVVREGTDESTGRRVAELENGDIIFAD